MKLAKKAEETQAKIQVDLDNMIEENLKQTASRLLSEYKEKIDSLSKDIDFNESIQFNAFQFIKGELDGYTKPDEIIKKATHSERVKVGEKWVENTEKKWYKPWTWFQESGHNTGIYESRDYVEASEVVMKFNAPFQAQLWQNCELCVSYAKEQTRLIKDYFRTIFIETDKILEKKVHELKACTVRDGELNDLILSTENKLNWLESIKMRIDSILDI